MQKHNSETSYDFIKSNSGMGKSVSVEEVKKIKEKASAWAKDQSTEKLESIKNKTGKMMGNSFEEISQIEWTLNAIDIELERRRQDEIQKAKEDILSIFKTSEPEKKEANPQVSDESAREKAKPK